jgi:hypothetical protein
MKRWWKVRTTDRLPSRAVPKSAGACSGSRRRSRRHSGTRPGLGLPARLSPMGWGPVSSKRRRSILELVMTRRLHIPQGSCLGEGLEESSLTAQQLVMQPIWAMGSQSRRSGGLRSVSSCRLPAGLPSRPSGTPRSTGAQALMWAINESRDRRSLKFAVD